MFFEAATIEVAKSCHQKKTRENQDRSIDRPKDRNSPRVHFEGVMHDDMACSTFGKIGRVVGDYWYRHLTRVKAAAGKKRSTGVPGKIDEGYKFWDFARFFFSSDWPQCILRKDGRALVKFPSE